MCQEKEILLCGEQAMSLREAALWEQGLRGEERGAAVVWEMRPKPDQWRAWMPGPQHRGQNWLRGERRVLSIRPKCDSQYLTKS